MPFTTLVVLLEQIRTLDKKRLREKMGHLPDDLMADVDKALFVSFGLGDKDRSPKSDRAVAASTVI